jgi:hypothetical protein
VSKKFLTPIDLNKNEIQNVVIQNLAGAPSSPVKGQMYFDSTGGNNTLYWWDGGQWIAAKAAAGATGASTVTTQAVGDAGVVGISTNFAREDHKHGMPAFANPTATTTFGLSAVNGSAATLARSDHTHGTPVHDAAAHAGIPQNAFAAPTADVPWGGFKITNLGTPVASTDASNKAYVDNLVAGLSWKEAVRVATTTTGTIATAFANGQTVDGVVLATNDRILLKNQGTGSENGIYTVNGSGAPTRATDADAVGELEGATVFVMEGTANADTSWVNTTNGVITPGTTATVWAQFASSGGAVPTARAVNTTAPLAGGGALSADLTLTIAASTTAVVGATRLATTAEATAASLATVAVTPAGLADRVLTTRTLTGTAPITVDGVNTAVDLSASRTIAIATATTAVVGASRFATTAEATAQTLATVGVTPAGLADRAKTTTTISTTAPLTGGGDLSTNRTLDISNFTLTVKGAVPPPTTATGKFLRDDGTWATAGAVNKFSQATVGGATSQVITHNLNSQAVTCEVYRTLTPWDTIECDIERTTVNTITLRFAVAPATNEYSVVVIG